MRMLILLLMPALVLALAPTLVSERPVGTDTVQFRSPFGNYSAKVVSGRTVLCMYNLNGREEYWELPDPPEPTAPTSSPAACE